LGEERQVKPNKVEQEKFKNKRKSFKPSYEKMPAVLKGNPPSYAKLVD